MPLRTLSINLNLVSLFLVDTHFKKSLFFFVNSLFVFLPSRSVTYLLLERLSYGYCLAPAM